MFCASSLQVPDTFPLLGALKNLAMISLKAVLGASAHEFGVMLAENIVRGDSESVKDLYTG